MTIDEEKEDLVHELLMVAEDVLDNDVETQGEYDQQVIARMISLISLMKREPEMIAYWDERGEDLNVVFDDVLQEAIKRFYTKNKELWAQSHPSSLALRELVAYCKARCSWEDARQIVGMLNSLYRPNATKEDAALIDSIEEEFRQRMYRPVNYDISVNGQGNYIAKDIHYYNNKEDHGQED